MKGPAIKNINFILLLSLTISCLHCDASKNNSANNFNRKIIKVVKLPSSLDEVSGITFSSEGNLFCHNDESGIIFQLDTLTGKLVKYFQIGSWGIEADFEDIAIAGERFFLITSSGILYEFKEGTNLEKVEFKEIDLGFSSNYEIEGLCCDPETNSLLIASKKYAGKKNKGKRAVYSFLLETNSLVDVPRFLLSLEEIENKFGIKEFFPSAISREPKTGNFHILSSKGGSSIIEIDNNGNLLAGFKLSNKKHPQPEGLAFTKNGKMFITDEAVNGAARITIYQTLK
ncbi:MAG: SdiA-regulated domain-containing protein [Ignavibacteriales bacterium]|nr:SdiA-regulated domain-containing protein [Ignavibacteriales bacterium]MCB9220017.1 SdiA-regulated domain-containing protein [Ignavibacteriales bacterium]